MLTPRTTSFPKSKPRPRLVMGLLSILVSCDLMQYSQALTYAVATPAARRAESSALTNILRADENEGASEVEGCSSRSSEKKKQVNDNGVVG